MFSDGNGKSLQGGDTLVQTDLAATLSAIAEQGPRGFYEGPCAEKLVKAVRDAGGIMTLDDLKSYQAVIRAPVRGTYRDYDIVSMPQPSSGGVVLLETLNILEGFPMHDMKQGTAPSLHLLIEAMKRACRPRALSRRSRLCQRADLNPGRKGLRGQTTREYRSRPCDAVERRIFPKAATRGQQHHAFFRCGQPRQRSQQYLHA